MLRRQFFGFAAAGAVWLGPRAARADEPFVLITPQQHEEELRAQAASPEVGEPPPRRRALFPLIRVIAPQGSGELASPLRLEVAFETSRDAQIVPSTFRLLYGLMRFDLTATLKRHATLSERGFVVEKAVVPQGTHRLLLQIGDNRGRVSEHEIRLRVAG